MSDNRPGLARPLFFPAVSESLTHHAASRTVSPGQPRKEEPWQSSPAR